MDTAISRRAVVTAGIAMLSTLAGCTDGSVSDAEESGSTPTEASDTSTTTDGRPLTNLDLREANVTEVVVARSGDGEFRFDVTLFHDDDGEEGYADWWQVETLDGERLGRRTLLHAHSTAPFTRSETVAIPADVDCVVVRGHDQTHGYGGQAMLVTLASGGTRTVQQGQERTPMTEQSCP